MSYCDVSVNITLMDCLLVIYWANVSRRQATVATLSQSHLSPHTLNTSHVTNWLDGHLTMLTCVKRRLEDSEADEGCYSREDSEGLSEGSGQDGRDRSERGDREIPCPADPNDPDQVSEYISLYLRSKVLPVREAQGRILMTKVLQV